MSLKGLFKFLANIEKTVAKVEVSLYFVLSIAMLVG